MSHVSVGTRGFEGVAKIGIVVVGYDKLEGDAMARERQERELEEGDGTGLALVGRISV